MVKAAKVIEAVTQKKKKKNISKNKKKSWKKHTDLSSIEAFLEQQQTELRADG